MYLKAQCAHISYQVLRVLAARGVGFVHGTIVEYGNAS